MLPSEGVDDGNSASLFIAGRGFKARLDEVDDRIRRNADVLSQIVDDSRTFLGDEEEEKEDEEEGKGKGEGKGEGAFGHESAVQESSHQVQGPAVESEKHTDVAADESVEEGQASGSNSYSNSNSNSNSDQTAKNRSSRQRIPDHDLDKVRSTIKQFVRDWSHEGTSEREAAYDPILEALENAFKHVSAVQRTQLRVLVPGAGLGRLAFEIAWLGFSCQGNEFR